MFIKAFLHYELNDIDAIAPHMYSKTIDEVTVYLRVFLSRFYELKEKSSKDSVIFKLQNTEFEEITKRSILRRLFLRYYYQHLGKNGGISECDIEL